MIAVVPRETKLFILTLAAAWYQENLRFTRGQPPPPPPSKSAALDIVTQTYVERTNAAAWTLARAREHFGER